MNTNRGDTHSFDRLESVPDTSSPAYAARHPLTRAFDRFASAVTRRAGSPLAFGVAAITILAWLISGPFFHYSDAWQLVINTGTTIITFLMVFLIQQSQNKDSIAVHLKLNELLAAQRTASDALIGIEDAPEEDLRRIAEVYQRLAERAGAKHAQQGPEGAVSSTVSQAKADMQCGNDAQEPS